MYLIIVLFTGLIVSVCGDEDALDDNSYYFGLLNGDEDTGVGREDKVETIQGKSQTVINRTKVKPYRI